MIHGRSLRRDEIATLWTIDRSEVIDAVYSVVDGRLVLRPERHDVRGWPAGEAEKYGPILEACHDRGGWFHGLFDGDRLAAVAVLDGRLLATGRERLPLPFLHVGRPYRGRGLGQRLFALARSEALRRGARSLYVSATPSERTIRFYLRQGCALTAEPDPELFTREPEDVHLELPLTGDRDVLPSRPR